MKLSKSARFQRSYKKLGNRPELKAAVDESLRLFAANPRFGPLHFEKLGGSKYRTIRVFHDGWRIVILGDKDTFEFVDVVPHDVADRKYG